MNTLGWGVVGLATVLPVVVAAYGDGPEPGNTGGFGEPTCASCHVDAPTNGAAGSRTSAPGTFTWRFSWTALGDSIYVTAVTARQE